MKKYIACLIVLVVSMFLTLALPGCSDLSIKASSVASVASQASGAVAGLVDVAMAAPVDANTRAQIANYGQWAKLATDAVSGVSTALSATDALQQATGTVEAVNKIVQAAPIDSGTKDSVGGWSTWALLALKAAGTLLPLVL